MNWLVKYHQIVAINTLVADAIRAAKPGEDAVVADVSSPVRRIPSHMIRSITNGDASTLHVFNAAGDHVATGFCQLAKGVSPDVICGRLAEFLARYSTMSSERFQAAIEVVL